MGRIELEHALAEVMDTVVASAVGIAGEYVDEPRAVDDRRAPGPPHSAAPIAQGHGRENTCLRERALVVGHDPSDVAAGALHLHGAAPEHALTALEHAPDP